MAELAAPQRTESVEEHLERILSTVQAMPPLATELDSALGLALAESLDARADVPDFPNSAMDGYAVRREDLLGAAEEAPVRLRVIADLPAGSAEEVTVLAGTAARIMTGAPIPAGADAIVPVEATDAGTGTVTVRQEPEPGAHIRLAGSDVRAGTIVLSAGQLLGARHLAAAAATGAATLTAIRRPRVGVVSTGSELVPLGEPLGRGKIHDSNSHLLAAAVTEAGGIPLRIGAVADDAALLEETLRRHAPEVDAYVLSGGASVGAYDVVKALLAPLGVGFTSVRMQPGKPQGFGLWNGIPVFCLPGNPVSSFVSFEVFVRPAIRRMRGLQDVLRPTIARPAAEGWRSPAGRRQYMPVRVEAEDSTGRILVRPASAGGSGSHLVTGLAGADALAVVPEDVTAVQSGDELPIMLLDG